MSRSYVMSTCVMSRLPANTRSGEKACPRCGAMMRVTTKGRFWTHWFLLVPSETQDTHQ